MRIIAGRFKGRKLLTPLNDAIRPTSDRTRESLFNLLMHGSYGGDQIIGQVVADLCCGTGALGLEAISRGAAECIFIDQDKQSLALAKDNALHCGVVAESQFIQADVARLPAARKACMLVMMDAPYKAPLTVPAFEALKKGGWFAPGALFVVEQQSTQDPAELDGAELREERRYGKAKLLVYQVA